MDEFFKHFSFVIDGLLRVLKPGRVVAMHVQQLASTLVGDGFIGLKDLRGRCVSEFVAHGWIYQGEVVIDKDPQAQAIRTHAKGLLFVQKERDSSWLRPALADYILVFRKPGENAVPIKADITNDEWIEWARPIWYGIRESDTLNAAEARENDDDRHICPLQLGTIERCIRLWSNPGEIVFSPFAGIGSEGYVALQQQRRFVGAELKPRYVSVARKNLALALMSRKQGDLYRKVRSGRLPSDTGHPRRVGRRARRRQAHRRRTTGAMSISSGRNWSLDLKRGTKQAIILSCRAHCENGKVIDRLREMGLWAPRGEAQPRPLTLVPRDPEPDSDAGWKIIFPIPDNAPPVPERPGRVARWTYRDAEGRPLCYTERYPAEKGGKNILPWSFWQSAAGAKAWKRNSPPKPHPLYGLDRLAARPDAPVVVHEGEKCADAGERLLKAYVLISWAGGVGRIKTADWAPLKGRRVFVWPDNDPSGRTAALEVRQYSTS